MDWLRVGLVLLVVVGSIEAQQGYSYPKPKTTFPDNRQPTSVGGSSISTAPSAQPTTGTSQTLFGIQQPGGYPSGDQPSGGQQPSAEFRGSGQIGVPSVTQKPFGTQQPFNGYARSQPEGQQPPSAYPGSGQSGTKPFGTQEPSGAQQPTITGYPDSRQPGAPSGTQRPFGTQQPSGTYPSEAQSGVSNGSQRPFAGYPSSEQPGVPSGTQRPFGTQQPSGTGAQPGASSGVQQPITGYPDSRQPGAPSGTQIPFGTYPSGSQPDISSAIQRPFGGYPSSGQHLVPTGTPGPFGTQQPTGSYPGSTQSSTQGPFAAQQPGYPSSGRQQPSSGFSGEQRPAIGRPVDAQQQGYQGSGILSQGTQGPSTGFLGEQRPEADRTADSQHPGVNVPSTNGRPQGSFSGQNQQGYNYPSPQRPLAGVRPGATESRTPGFGQRPSVSSASESSFGEAGITGTPQFSSGAEKPLEGYPTPSRERPSSQQFPSSYSSPSGAEPQYPSGGAQNQVPRGKQGRGEFSGEGRFPIGQTDRSRFEGTTERQFPSGGVTQSSGIFGGQESSRRPAGYSQTGRPTRPQIPSEGSTQTIGSSDRPGFPLRPTGQVNGYSDTTTQPGFPNVESNELPGKAGSTRYPQNDQRPLSSYLPPGGRGTGDLPLAESPASRYPSSGFTSQGSRTPSTSRLPSGRSEEPTGYKNGFGVSTQPTGGISFDGKPSGRPEQPTSSQNGYNVPSTTGRTLSGFTQSSGGPEQSTSSQNGYNVPSSLTGRVLSGGGSLGSQFPSGKSGPQQGINGYSRASQQFDRPGTTYASDAGSAFDGSTQEGLSRRISDQRFPGSPQGPRDFIPGQPRPSDEETGDEDEGDYSAIPGQAGRDYPIFSDVPETSFDCDDQEYRGYYADVETRCQIFHICANNKTYDFLCPNGTVFHQEHLVCVWWNQFDCDTAPSLYRVNEHIYDFSIFGSQQTGGIPVPGQDYPELREGFLELEGTSGTGIVSQTPQGPGIFGDGVRRPAGYPREGPQVPTGPSSSGRPVSEAQRPGGYTNGRPQGPTGRYPSVGTEENTSGGLRRPNEDQRPGGYSSERPQGSNGGYPGTTAQGRGEYPSGGLQRPDGGVQRPAEYPSENPQGYPNGRPQGGEENQFTGQESQRPAGSGQGLEKPLGTSTGYPQRPSNGKAQTQGYPSGRPTGSVGQRPGQYEGEGISRPGSIGVSQQGGYPSERPQVTGPGGRPATPQGYGVPEGPRPQSQRPGTASSQEPSGYPTGTPAGFPSGSQSSPSESESLFPGSPKPHQPTREYLPV